MMSILSGVVGIPGNKAVVQEAPDCSRNHAQNVPKQHPKTEEHDECPDEQSVEKDSKKTRPPTYGEKNEEVFLVGLAAWNGPIPVPFVFLKWPVGADEAGGDVADRQPGQQDQAVDSQFPDNQFPLLRLLVELYSKYYYKSTDLMRNDFNHSDYKSTELLRNVLYSF